MRGAADESGIARSLTPTWAERLLCADLVPWSKPIAAR